MIFGIVILIFMYLNGLKITTQWMKHIALHVCIYYIIKLIVLMEILTFLLPYYDRIIHEIRFISIAILHFQERLSSNVKPQIYVVCQMLCLREIEEELEEDEHEWVNNYEKLTYIKLYWLKLTHCGPVAQICVFTLQLCKRDDANLRF